MAHADHDHNHQGEQGHDSSVIWKGVVILTVLAVFFVIERLLNIFGEWRQRKQSTKQVISIQNKFLNVIKFDILFRLTKLLTS